MHTLEIILQRKTGPAWPVVAVENRTGEFLSVRSEGTFALDLADLNAAGLPRDYGTLLGKNLFRDELRDAFTRAVQQASAAAEPLHLLLTVEDGELRRLHWERLCAPLDGWDFLALQQQTVFSLYLPALSDRRFPPIGRRDLRALLLVAGPQDLPDNYELDPFDLPATVQTVRTALGPVPCDVLAGVEGAVGKPDLNTLCARLTAESYTFLHIVCHGRSLANGETALYLPGDNGLPVTASQLLERLGRIRGPRSLPYFAFLMSCESANPEAENGFGGLGQRLVRELGMPAVLAMTAPITIPTANLLAGSFYTRLREHGEPDRALSEALAGLMGRSDATVPAVFSRLGGRPLFSMDLDRRLTPVEIAHGADLLAGQAARRAPLAQPELAELAARLRAFPEEAGLSPALRQERDAALASADQWAQEILDLSFNALALDRPFPPYDERCPFRGLASFRAEDRAFFFGREALVQTLAGRLAEHPFLAVLGASGSGKSSLVLAGLVPALGGAAAYLTPGADPLARLAAARSGAPAPAPLVVDQFEELFTLCRSPEQRGAFIAELLGLAAERKVIVTLRADFLGECAPYPDLKAALQAHTELVAPLDAAGLRRAIEQQAGAVGLRFEAGLAEDILDDVQGEPGAMPLLQHALLRLWQRRRGRWLRASEYRAAGGVRAAIAQTADEIYTTLAEGERERMRAAFLRLTRPDEDVTPGVERRDTRRRVTLDELVPAGTERRETVELVRRLADARLVITAANPLSGQEEVEVAHEALIRHWPRLRAWLDEDRAALHLGEGVREAAQEWDQGKQDDGLLVHRGARLEEARELAGSRRYPFTQAELVYLEACRSFQEKQRLEQERQRRLRERLRNTLLVGALVAAVIMAVLGIWGLQQAQSAGQQAAAARQAQQQAELSAARANSRQLAAQSTETRATRLDLALLLAVEAERAADTFEARSALLGALSQRPQIWRFLSGPAFWVRSLAITPEGHLLAAGYDQALYRLDLASGQPVGTPLAALAGFDWKPEFLPDGKISAAGSLLPGILWDQNSADPLVFDRHSLAVAIRPDGKQAAVNTPQGEIQLWNLETGQKAGRLPAGGVLNHLSYSPDGRWLAAVDPERPLQVWDLGVDSRIPAFLLEDLPVAFATFSPDGRSLAVCGGKHGLALLDLASRQLRTPPAKSGEGCELAPVFSADGELLLASTRTYPIAVWDLRASQIFGTSYVEAARSSSTPTSLAFAPSGKSVYVGDQAGQIWSLSVDRSRRFVSIIASEWIHTAGVPVTALAFDPVRAALISGSADGSLIEWYTTPQDRHRVIFADSRPGLSSGRGLFAAVFGPEPDTLTAILASENTEKVRPAIIARFNAQNGTWSRPLLESSGSLLTLSPDGSRLAWFENQELRLRRLDGGQEVARAQSALFPGEPFELNFSPDGRWLAVTGCARAVERDCLEVRLRVLAADSLEIQAAEVTGADLAGPVFTPDGRSLAYLSEETIFLWPLSGGQPVALNAQPLSGLTRLAFSPDGQRLAWSACPRTAGAPCSQAQVGLIDLASRQPAGPVLKMATISLSGLTFSPDGRILAALSAWGGIILWDTTAWQPYPLRFAPQGREGDLVAAGNLTFSPDSHFLITVDTWSFEGFNELYRLDPAAWLTAACTQANRSLSEAEWGQYLPDLPYRQSCMDR